MCELSWNLGALAWTGIALLNNKSMAIFPAIYYNEIYFHSSFPPFKKKACEISFHFIQSFNACWECYRCVACIFVILICIVGIFCKSYCFFVCVLLHWCEDWWRRNSHGKCSWAGLGQGNLAVKCKSVQPVCDFSYLEIKWVTVVPVLGSI
jgi:hypothetical protein